MDLLSTFLDTVLGLLVNGTQITLFLLAASLLALFIFNSVHHRTKWKWIGSTVLTLFLVIAIPLLLFHTLNIWNGAGDTNLNQIPPDIRTQPEYAATQSSPFLLFFRALIQTILTSAVLTLVFLPAAFLGTTLFDVLEERIPGVWARLAVTCFIGSLALLVVLAAFPWILVSLVYLAIFGI